MGKEGMKGIMALLLVWVAVGCLCAQCWGFALPLKAEAMGAETETPLPVETQTGENSMVDKVLSFISVLVGAVCTVMMCIGKVKKAYTHLTEDNAAEGAEQGTMATHSSMRDADSGQRTDASRERAGAMEGNDARVERIHDVPYDERNPKEE